MGMETLMNTEVIIGKMTTTRDDNRNPVPAWETLYFTPARIRSLRSHERYISNRMKAEVTDRIYLPPDPQLLILFTLTEDLNAEISYGIDAISYTYEIVEKVPFNYAEDKNFPRYRLGGRISFPGRHHWELDAVVIHNA